jgi:sec-independent protein translocase protein TatB
MGSLQLGELLTILVVVLIIFGPDKLPELARRAGTMVRKVRETSAALRDELGSEYDETLSTLQDVRRELKAVRDDVTSTATGALSGLDATAQSMSQPAVPAKPKDGTPPPTPPSPDSPGATSTDGAPDKVAGDDESQASL